VIKINDDSILLIIADDFGVHQLSCTNDGPGAGSFFATPHLDRLASDGVRFARAYATAPVCSLTYFLVAQPEIRSVAVNAETPRMVNCRLTVCMDFSLSDSVS